jgi:2-polyprenyl-3-methyl-5-hydroxy-6-metoxy-1,4-benzoquinol methylase
MHPDDALTPEKEKYRYMAHKNDVNDLRYRKFVSPIVEAVKKSFNLNHSGLDFGCGTGPVASQMLTEHGYALALYDPFFADNESALAASYDYIICCEVIEHFRRPAVEFKMLKGILNPGGMLICMTQLINENTNFHEWRYRFDPTHVFFYHKDTVDWIKNRFGFTSADINGRIIILIS